MEPILAWIWFSQLFSYGSDRPRQLLEQGASPEALMEMPVEEIVSLYSLPEAEIRRMKTVSVGRAEHILKECRRKRITLISYEDEHFPARLRDIYGPPVLLYAIGDLSVLKNPLSITIVGTRETEAYTERFTRMVASELASAGITVVSGCAVGIDRAAHEAALDAGGKSIGILACGMDIDYPEATHGVKVRLARQGVLLTELPPGTHVSSRYFATRNRLLSGLSLGTLVTHAPMRSGSLLTLNHALEQGKECFCLPPADVFSPSYAGVIPFLRDGAIPCFCTEDILSQYREQYGELIQSKTPMADWVKPAVPYRETQREALPAAPRLDPDREKERRRRFDQAAASLLEELTDGQRQIYQALHFVPRQIDEIAAEIGMETGLLLSELTQLELVGLASPCGGGRYSLAAELSHEQK